jgi:hypothetical protein
MKAKTPLHSSCIDFPVFASRSRTADGRISASFCGPCHLERAYAEARQRGYLWHEFGDSHLILANPAAYASA